MCENIHKVYNKYTGKSLYVNCRNCIPCQQQKADKRAQRIRFHALQDDLQCLFFHLTYSNEFVPYFRYSDLKFAKTHGIFQLPVYRDFSCKYTNRSKNKKNSILLRKYNPSVIKTIDLTDFLSQININEKLHSMTNSDDFDKISVVVQSDIQKFFKRLRKELSYISLSIDENLKKGKNVTIQKDELPFTYFQVSEYGSDNQRAHFHVLLFAKNAAKNYKFWQRQVCKAWPFALRNITKRRFEVARDAAAYCSSYICKSADLPSLFKFRGFRSAWSHSVNFAVDSKLFTIDFLTDCIKRESFEFDYEFNTKKGTNSVRITVPSYIIRHYFPVFRGFNYLSASELQEILESPDDYTRYQELASKMRLFKKDSFEVDYNLVERSYMYFVRKIQSMIEIFHDSPIFLYPKVREIERRQLVKYMYDDSFWKPNLPAYEKYYNVLDLKKNPRIAPTLFSMVNEISVDSLIPSNYYSNVIKDVRLKDKYYGRLKYKDFSQNLNLLVYG